MPKPMIKVEQKWAKQIPSRTWGWCHIFQHLEVCWTFTSMCRRNNNRNGLDKSQWFLGGGWLGFPFRSCLCFPDQALGQLSAPHVFHPRALATVPKNVCRLFFMAAFGCYSYMLPSSLQWWYLTVTSNLAQCGTLECEPPLGQASWASVPPELRPASRTFEASSGRGMQLLKGMYRFSFARCHCRCQPSVSVHGGTQSDPKIGIESIDSYSSPTYPWSECHHAKLWPKPVRLLSSRFAYIQSIVYPFEPSGLLVWIGMASCSPFFWWFEIGCEMTQTHRMSSRLALRFTSQQSPVGDWDRKLGADGSPRTLHYDKSVWQFW